MMWNPSYTGEEVNGPSTTVTNPPGWLIQLFSHLEKGEKDVKLLADTTNTEDDIGIDIFHIHDYYKTLIKNLSELFEEINKDTTLQNALI
jgi:hypothetical protein